MTVVLKGITNLYIYKMTYRANFNANGTYFKHCVVDTDKQRLLRNIKEIAKGYWSKGGIVTFYMIDEDYKEVYVGMIQTNGVTSYSVYNYQRNL